MAWDENRVSQLKLLWARGFSASRIAAELGGTTRNAVIGKIHRMKLSGALASAPDTSYREPTQECTDPAGVRPSAPLIQENSPLPLTLGNVAFDLNTDEALVSQPSVLPSTEDREQSQELISLVDLTPRTCRWPIGDPMEGDFGFCGRETAEDMPYCPYHSARAYQTGSSRRRAARVPASPFPQ